VPVITSRGIATEEVAGGAALLVDPTSVEEIAGAMQKMMTDDSFRTSLAERGSARVKAFSWQKTARGTVAAFRESVDG
ncbi:glycosyltransferase family 1 protein, partial [Patescibacteria group bacterium]|nr:glycosyltransferase family 1 protein [Patescibacteria group bacterium]